jgi:hypothetical protein
MCFLFLNFLIRSKNFAMKTQCIRILIYVKAFYLILIFMILFDNFKLNELSLIEHRYGLNKKNGCMLT